MRRCAEASDVGSAKDAMTDQTRCAYLGGHLQEPVGSGLPRDDGHLLLDDLDVGRPASILRRPVRNVDDALRIFAYLLRPVLRG